MEPAIPLRLSNARYRVLVVPSTVSHLFPRRGDGPSELSRKLVELADIRARLAAPLRPSESAWVLQRLGGHAGVAGYVQRVQAAEDACRYASDVLIAEARAAALAASRGRVAAQAAPFRRRGPTRGSAQLLAARR